MVDVIEQLDPRRADPLDHLDPEGGPVSHVVLVIDLAVEQLDTDGHPVFFGGAGHPLETGDAVGRPLLVAPPLSVAEHGDEIGHPGRGRQGKRAFQLAHQEIVVGGIVEAAAEEIPPARRVSHRADQPRRLHHRPLLYLQQIDRDQPDLPALPSEFRQGNLRVGPVGDGLFQAAGRQDGTVAGRQDGRCRLPVAGCRLPDTNAGHRDQSCDHFTTIHQNLRFLR